MTDTSEAVTGGTMTGGEAMAHQLVAEGITDVFGIPGIQLDSASNGFGRIGSKIRFINARHEQTATYAADGYARTTGKVGVGLVVPGPGVLNAASGLVTSLACSSKVMMLAGQIPSATIGKGLGMLHEIPDQHGILKTLNRWAGLAMHIEEVPTTIRSAMQFLEGSPGPVSVEIPPDILEATGPVDMITPTPAEPMSPGAPADLEAAAEMLAAAERPVIFIGGGAMEAGEQVIRLAQILNAPIAQSAGGRGAIDDRHPLALLPMEGRDVMKRADTVLVVGTRALDNLGRAVRFPDDAKTIFVNLYESEVSEPRNPTHTVIGDAAAALGALADRLGDSEKAPWATDLDEVRAENAAKLVSLEPTLSYVKALRAAMPDDGVLISELTQVAYMGRVAFPVHAPRSYVNPGYQGTLGYGYPTAIGAKAGNPDRPVVSINGDGGFGYGLAEMATVMNHKLAVIGVVFRDNAFGNVQRMHKQKFDGQTVGTDLYNPDMVQLASAFGMAGYQANSPEEFERTLADAIQKNEPCLIDVPLGPLPDPWGIIR